MVEAAYTYIQVVRPTTKQFASEDGYGITRRKIAMNNQFEIERALENDRKSKKQEHHGGAQLGIGCAIPVIVFLLVLVAIAS
jgi:hypothetical protein